MPENARPSIARTVAISIGLLAALAADAFAVPGTSGLRLTDVTPTSFSVVWLTDVAANPDVEVYADRGMTTRIEEGISIAAMPAEDQRVADAARAKGIMKVRVSGLVPSTTYYSRSVTRDPADPLSVCYSPLQEVVTAARVAAHREIGGAARAYSNDLLAFGVYVRPLETEPEPALGDLLVIETDGALSPVSAFVGDTIGAGEGLADLNNLFGADGVSLDLLGGERVLIRIYRTGGLSTLLHYRRAAPDSGIVEVVPPVKGPAADVNLDGSWTTYDEFGNRAYRYEISPRTHHGPGYHVYDNSGLNGGVGKGPPGPHIPFE